MRARIESGIVSLFFAASAMALPARAHAAWPTPPAYEAAEEEDAEITALAALAEDVWNDAGATDDPDWTPPVHEAHLSGGWPFYVTLTGLAYLTVFVVYLRNNRELNALKKKHKALKKEHREVLQNGDLREHRALEADLEAFAEQARQVHRAGSPEDFEALRQRKADIVAQMDKMCEPRG